MNFVSIGSITHAYALGQGNCLRNFKANGICNIGVFYFGKNSVSIAPPFAARAYGCLACDNALFIDSIALAAMHVYHGEKYSDPMHLSKPFFERSVYGRILRCHFKS